MKYYHRQITKREEINRWGKLGYIIYDEYVKTNDIAPFNKGKRIKFTEIYRPRVLVHAKVDTIIEISHDISNTEAYFRKSVSSYRR